MIILCRWLRYYEFHVLKYKKTSKLLCWDSWINIRHCSTIFESNELCPYWVFFSYFSNFDLIRRLKFKSNMYFEKKPIQSFFFIWILAICIHYYLFQIFSRRKTKWMKFLKSLFPHIKTLSVKSISYKIQGVKVFDRYR